MTLIFVILIILASVVLGLIVLIQNPKGGGLAGNIAGFSNQLMGVKQTTDVLEKGTWIFGSVIAVLCIVSSIFIEGGGGSSRNFTPNPGGANQQQQQQTNPLPGNPGGTNPAPATTNPDTSK
jgi:preprotein translocase subunit SecG